MTVSGLFYQYTLYATSLVYLVVLWRYIQCYQRLPGRHWLTVAVGCWPLLVIDEWLKLFELSALSPFTWLFEFVPVLLLAACYKAARPLMLDRVKKYSRMWVVVAAVMLAQIPLWLTSPDIKMQWFMAAPVGEPLIYWPFYLVPLLTGFGVLLFGILIAEDVQHYHQLLPAQVVDVNQYKIRRMAGVMGATVGIAFSCILLVSAAAFGFFTIPFWLSLFHLVMAVTCLFVIGALVSPRTTSPCPLDMQRLDACDESQAVMRDTLARAEQTIIHTKGYKQLGLTIKAFSQDADIDPTLLAIALRMSPRKNFRGFVYHYRLEYAKKVLLRSDAKINRVARRLGINSEKFLSGALVSYLRKMD
ncbi:DNA mismatch repair protein [Alteromonas halophila]|uniref:HTH araC/xylS-type domain-containing protein n=1 Tax=Alteromonas halophila TaxID=516698 RepID=A0A918JGB8_9ALTE|nr:DNA mismatch repair protein [Alteromonas halophila]GGW79976.1 hypothetical protein GCM10007391_11000 [Alteromonas halophila]